MSRPESFGFPFQPYDIQESFMKKLFDVLSNEEFGIFESRESPFF
jgi:chromosome transmission fidelity protein 1